MKSFTFIWFVLLGLLLRPYISLNDGDSESQAGDYSDVWPCYVDQDCFEGFKCVDQHCMPSHLVAMASDTPWCYKDEDCLLAGPGFLCEDEFCVKITLQIRVLNMKIAEDDKDVSYRLPLPGRSKAQMEADSDSDEGDDSPAFDSMLERFKKLQAKASKSSLGDYLELPKEIGEISLSSSLRSGVKETDLYLKTEGDLVVCKRNTSSKANDVSGAALSDFKPHVGKRKLKKLKRAEREKTKGSDWYNMPATELTEERKKDLELLQMRNVLDPKRFYKKNNSETLPKYFQIGTVVDSASDFYTDRVAKKDRKQTMVDELLADAEFKKYQKRKYVQIIDDKIKKEGKFFHKKKKKH